MEKGITIMTTNIRKYIGKRKYEILLVSLLVLMFGVRPTSVNPFLPIQVMVVGTIIFYDRRFLWYMIVGLLTVTIALFFASHIFHVEAINSRSLLGITFIIYFIIITVEVFRRILAVDRVAPEIISAVLCGFIMLCFIGCFLFDFIETYTHGSFSGLGESKRKLNTLLYFSVSNQLTLGFGDIVPISFFARKAVMFMGLVGHFYTVLVTAIIIGKYINQRK